MAELRSAIVGCGGIAQVHARALSEMPEAELIAFADVIPERAETMAGKYGGRAYSSLDELLDHEKIDVLHICTPHYLHTPMAQAAAERGINVFTEKPPVIDRQQWTEFKQLGDKVRVGICFQNRYNGSTRALKDLLSTGEPGKVLGSRGFVTWRRDAPYYTESGWRGALSTEGGGALINQAIHTLDLMAYFLGPGQVLGASLSNRHLKGIIEVRTPWRPPWTSATPGACSTPPPPTPWTRPSSLSWPARTPLSALRASASPASGGMAAWSRRTTPPRTPPSPASPTGAAATGAA